MVQQMLWAFADHKGKGPQQTVAPLGQFVVERGGAATHLRTGDLAAAEFLDDPLRLAGRRA